MNQLQPYEILIAEKLAALPIPDMADMIWARIEARLDIDLPTDDNGDDNSDGPDSGPFPPGKILTGLGLSALIVALVTFFYQNQSHPGIKTIVPVNTIPPAIIPESPSGNQNHSPPVSVQPTSDPPLRKNNPGASSVPGTFDSSMEVLPIGVIPRLAVDSSLRVSSPLIKSPSVQFPPAAKDTLAKKPRGVQGISDEDYRIAPKKDSS